MSAPQAVPDPKLEAELQRDLQILDEVDANIERCRNMIIARGEGRRRIPVEMLMNSERCSPEFEHRLEIGYKLRQKCPRLHLPKAFWFFSVTGVFDRELVVGGLVGDDLMVISADSREQADLLAKRGLDSTLEIARDMRGSLIALPGVEENPLARENVELTRAGRRAHKGDPMRRDMVDRISRIFNTPRRQR